MTNKTTRTEFEIKIIEDFKQCNSITFIDQSIYNPNVPVTSPILRITLPNFNQYVEIEYQPNKVNHFNGEILGIGKGCLIDGLWKLELSICPNDTLKKEFYYYNICSAMRMIARAVCEDPSEKNILKVMEIKEKLLAVQMLNDINKADFLYNNIVSQLNSMC